MSKRYTDGPWICRECGHKGVACEEVLEDRVPYGSGIALLEQGGDVSCAFCGSDDVQEVD